MTTYDAAFADRNAGILARAPAANPATLGEIWRSEWQASGLDTMTGVGRPWQEAYDELEGAFHAMTGETVFDAARRKGVKLPSSSFDGRADAVRQLIGDLDQSKRFGIEPFLDVRGRARAKAAETEKQASDVADRTYGLSSTAVGFLAGVARQAVDPANLATLPLGAGRGVSVLRMLGTEAGVGFATQAVQEPVIQAGRAELGLEAGFAEGLRNSVEAGIGAAGFAGLLRGAGYLLRRGFAADAPIGAIDQPAGATGADLAAAARGLEDPAGGSAMTLSRAEFDPALSPLREADPQLRAAFADLDPDDFAAAAHLVERDALVDRLAPIDGDEGRLVHQQGVDLATTALETGRAGELQATLREQLAEPTRQARRNQPARPLKPLSLTQFIARNGGLELTADAEHAAFNRHFVPGGGMLSRRSGRSIDGFWRERLMEEGYLSRDADGGMARDIHDELFELIQNEQRGQRIYAQRDQAEMIEADATRISDLDRDIEAAAGRILEENERFGGGEIDTRSLYEAAEILHRGEETDPLDALERAFVRQVLNDELPPSAQAHYDIPDFEEPADALQRGPAQEDGRGPAAGGAGRDGSRSAQGDRGTGQDGDAPGDGGGSPLDAQGLNPKDPEAAARRADVERALAENGGDLDLFMPGPDGQVVKTSARAHFDLIAADAKAADELKACLGLKAAA